MLNDINLFCVYGNILFIYWCLNWPPTTNLSDSFTCGLEGCQGMWNDTFVNSKLLSYSHQACYNFTTRKVVQMVSSSYIASRNLSLAWYAFCVFSRHLRCFVHWIFIALIATGEEGMRYLLKEGSLFQRLEKIDFWFWEVGHSGIIMFILFLYFSLNFYADF